jgi:hypothetical protein
MRNGNSIIIVIFIIIFVLSFLKKLAQSIAEANKGAGAGAPGGAQGGQQGAAPQKPDVEASRSEVEDFLRSLQDSRRQQGQVQAPAPPRQGAQRRPQGPQRQGGRVQAGRPQEAPFWLGQPPQPVNEEGPTTTLVQLDAPTVSPAVPAVRPTAARRRRKDEDAVETLVAKEPVKETAPTVAEAAGVALSDLKKLGLKKAVIWSEILGPPLSLRRRGGHRPSIFPR